ncbi:Volume-regulated anion channel subunit LRRC8E [Acropora cervicornis]|uniref:Volume-regulated anion channel subunit LRRC8E n=1 Tax=Acropora cervicornis TaxID=6130 RepID=A0AAD9UZV2_ACRCE|nr:Volume-regulated anion channel subunit LRRC8E [Acropora cervicornis]
MNNLEKIENKKYLITWWDLVDHYLLAAMLVVSVGSFGLQSSQDRLICLPAVNRSPITAGNDSALRNRSSSSVVSLFKMPDRRHYDYVDNECYEKMYGWNRCNLDDVDYATEVKGSFFQCSRTIGTSNSAQKN